IVLDQRALELVAGVDEDLPGYLLLQLRDLVHHVALQDGRVAPPGLGEGRGHDVLGMLFSRSAHSPVRDAHRVANHSSLRRPSSRASARSASSVSTSAHCSRSLPPNWPNQPPSLKPSSPSGSWTTPSSEAFVVITIFPMPV